MLVTLPFVLLLLDYWPLCRTVFSRFSSNLICARLNNRNLILEKVPLFIISVVFSVIAYIAQSQSGAVSTLDKIPAGARFANAAVAYVAYIRQMFLPTNLGVLYPHPRDTLPTWQVVGAVLLLILLTLAVLRIMDRKPYVGMGWAWYIGTLIPVVGFVQVGAQAMADRYTYIPLIGLFIIVAWGIPDLVGRVRNNGSKEIPETGQLSYSSFIRCSVLPITAIIIFIALGICSWIQTKYWQNSIELFKRAVAVTHNNCIALVNLSGVLTKEDKINEAKAYLMRAIEIRPDAKAYNNLAIISEKEGKIDEAIAYFLEAIEYDPNYAGAHYNLANLLAREGRLAEAVSHYKQAIALQPENVKAHVNLAITFARLGKIDEAVYECRKALSISPKNTEAMGKLAEFLADQGKTDEAEGLYRELLRLNPSDAGAHFNLGSLLGTQGKLDEEIAEYRKALQIKPDFAEVHNNLAVALYYKGEYAEAWEEVRLSRKFGIQPAPDFIKALSTKMPEP